MLMIPICIRGVNAEDLMITADLHTHTPHTSKHTYTYSKSGSANEGVADDKMSPGGVRVKVTALELRLG